MIPVATVRSVGWRSQSGASHSSDSEPMERRLSLHEAIADMQCAFKEALWNAWAMEQEGDAPDCERHPTERTIAFYHLLTDVSLKFIFTTIKIYGILIR